MGLLEYILTFVRCGSRRLLSVLSSGEGQEPGNTVRTFARSRAPPRK